MSMQMRQFNLISRGKKNKKKNGTALYLAREGRLLLSNLLYKFRIGDYLILATGKVILR